MTARQLAWRACYELLAARVTRPEWAFMNYGYAPETEDAAGPALDPADEPDRYCIQLYAHTVSPVDLVGKDVLEVGCGRGGGSSFLHRYLGPSSVTGVDLSERAVRLCTRHRAAPGLTFVQGDAQRLPLPDASVDVVVNVESSHCYDSMGAFLSEAHRVLRPGGSLVWADLRGHDGVADLREHLDSSPLQVREVHDVTAGVLRALQLDDARKTALMEAWIPRPFHGVFRPFAGLEGTRNVEGFRSGRTQYLRAWLTKG